MTAITPRESNTLQLAAQAMQLFDFGGMLIKSGMLPSSVRSPEAAVAIMVKGMELGLPAMAALNGITVIQGKPTVSPQLMLSLINRSGQLENIEIDTGAQGATVTMKRRGRTPFTAKFGPAEAQAMGLHTKDNYKKQAPVMYQWRAVAACARVVFPDVIDGLYTPEEMGADVQVDEDGAMTVSVQQESKSAHAEPDDAALMEARMKAYGPKLAARREAIKKYGITDKQVTDFLADLPDWRASDENAERAVSKLTEWGKGLKAAQVSESETQDVVDAELKPVQAAVDAPLNRGQEQTLVMIAKGAGAATSEARAQLWAYMLNATAPVPTKQLTDEQAAFLIDTFSSLSPEERQQANDEAARAMKGALL